MPIIESTALEVAQRRLRTRVLFTTACLAVACLAIALPAAHAQELGFNLRLNSTRTLPNTRSVDTRPSDFQIERETGETFGLALSGEFRFSDRLGVEVGVQAGYDVRVDYAVRDNVSGGTAGDGLDPHPGDHMRFTIVDAALNIYLSSGGVDFYVGPVLGFISYQDTTIRRGSEDPKVTVTNDGDVAYGAVVGLDIPFIDSPWFVTSSIKYLVSSYDSTIGKGIAEPDQTFKSEVDFDPWIFRFGLGYKF